MADLMGTFKDKAESLVTAINSEGGIKATIESLRRRMAEADRKRTIRRLKSELQRIERQIGEMLTAVGVQAVALKRADALSSPELAPLCERIIDLEELLQEQKKELNRIEAEALAQTATPVAPAAAGATCPNCGKPLTTAGEFCPYCGQARATPQSEAPTFCAHCGAPLREGARFCARCGKETTA